MSSVVPFGPRPPKPEQNALEGHDGPDLSGKIVCLGCKHEWVGLAYSGSHDRKREELGFECKACGQMKGRFVRFVRPNRPLWTCSYCGETLFTIFEHADGNTPCVMCVECGCVANALDLFPSP